MGVKGCGLADLTEEGSKLPTALSNPDVDVASDHNGACSFQTPEGCSLKILANILRVKGLWEASPKPSCSGVSPSWLTAPASQRQIQGASIQPMP